MTRKSFFLYILPAIISSTIEPLMSLTDVVIIGHIPTGASVGIACIGLAATLLNTIIWSMGQFRSALSSSVARYLGMNKLNELNPVVVHILALNISIGLLLILLSFAFAKLFFALYTTQAAEVIDTTTNYYMIRALGLPFILGFSILFGVFRGLQNATWSMYISIVGALLNVGLSYYFVYGLYENPDYMVATRQVAIASLISEGVMFSLAFYTYRKHTPLAFKITRTIHKECKIIILMSFNLLIRTLALNFVIHTSNYMAARSGTVALAVQSVLLNLWLFASFFMDGITSYVNMLSGKLLGEGKLLDIKKLVRSTLHFVIKVALMIALVSSIFYLPIGRLFNENIVFLDMFIGLFWIVIAIQPIASITYTFDALFKGLGWGKDLRNILLLSSLIIFPVFLWIGYSLLGWEMHGIWVAFVLWLLARGLLGYWFFQRNMNALLILHSTIRK